MSVIYDEKMKNLPGYMQVYKDELKVKIAARFTTTITATEDRSMHTFMIRYTPEGTFQEKYSVSTTFRNILTLIIITIFSLAVATGMLSEGRYIAAAIPVSLLLFMLARILLIKFDKSDRSTVCIDGTGISLPNMSFKWEEMSGTFIVNRCAPREIYTFLVLALKNGNNVYFPLAAFSNSAPRFATAIKHLKPLPTPSR